MPHLFMFTITPIQAGEEILISYSDGFWLSHSNKTKQLQVLAVSCHPYLSDKLQMTGRPTS